MRRDRSQGTGFTISAVHISGFSGFLVEQVLCPHFPEFHQGLLPQVFNPLGIEVVCDVVEDPLRTDQAQSFV